MSAVAVPAPFRARRAVAAHRLWLPATVAVTAAAVLGRQGGAGSLDTLYAEDGRVFLATALREPAWDALATPYAGYVHVVPRAIAAAVTWFPLRDAATLFAVAAAVVTGCAVALVLAASRSVVDDARLRLVAAVPFALVPLGGEEVFNTVANLHWLLLPLAFWMLVWPTTTNRQVATAAGALALAALSDPFVVLLAPVAAWRLATDRSAGGRRVVAVGAVAVALQWLLTALSSASREGLEPTANVVRVGAWFLRDVLAGLVVGERVLGGVPDVAGVALGVVVGALALRLLHRAHRVLDRPTLALCAAGLVSAAALYLVPVTLTGTHPPRYSVPPAIVLVSVAVIAVDRWPTRFVRTPVAVLAAVAVATCWATSFRLDNRRADGPTWHGELERVAARCAGSAQAAVLPITPPGWSLVVPCAEVEGP